MWFYDTKNNVDNYGFHKLNPSLKNSEKEIEEYEDIAYNFLSSCKWVKSIERHKITGFQITGICINIKETLSYLLDEEILQSITRENMNEELQITVELGRFYIS